MRSDHTPVSYRFALLAGAMGLACLVNTGSALAQLAFFSSPVVGRMGSIEITARQINELVAAQNAETRKALLAQPEAVKNLILSELLRRTMLAEARNAEWEKRPDVAVAMERAKEQAVIDNYVFARAEPDAAYPSAAEIQSAYDQNLAQFQVPAQIRLAQILIRVPEKPSAEDSKRASTLAQEISQKLQRGEDFAALAGQYSQDQASKDRGGELDWLEEARLTGQIRTTVNALKGRTASPPVNTPFGWQIIRVLERKAATTRPLTEVREAIIKGLRDARINQNRQAMMEAVGKKTPASVEEKNLKDIVIK